MFCVYVPSGHSTRKHLTRGRFFEGLQNYMVNKNKNKNKIILWDFNCTIDKMDRDGGNKTQKIYRWTSAYALSKLIADNKLRYLWRRENPGSTDFTHYDRSSGTWSRIDRAYTDIKVTSNTKINHISVSFTDHYHAIFFFFFDGN